MYAGFGMSSEQDARTTRMRAIKEPTMQLEDYFNILTPNDIRIKGSRIGIETILYEYIYRARTPE